MRKILFICTIGLIAFSCSSPKPEANSDNNGADPKPESMIVEKKVFFVQPQNGDTLSSPVNIQMGVSGMQIEPAGISREGYGHHHILINQESWPANEIIPMSDSTFHYGKGQTEATLELEPGEYVLSLQFADGVHASYGESMAASIKVIIQ